MEKKLDGDIPCGDCGTETNPMWFTDNVFWNEVMGDEKVKILCPYCFIGRAEQIFTPTGWRLLPEFKWQEKSEKNN